MIPEDYTSWSGFVQSKLPEQNKKGSNMHLAGDSYSIDVGTFVMNMHHGLVRLGVVKSKTFEENGHAYYEVEFFEDDIHKKKVEWDKRLNSKTVNTNKIRGCYLKRLSPQWLQNVLDAYGRYENERRTEIG